MPVPEDFYNVEGKGVQGIVDGRGVVVGRDSLLADWSQPLSPDLAEAQAQKAKLAAALKPILA